MAFSTPIAAALFLDALAQNLREEGHKQSAASTRACADLIRKLHADMRLRAEPKESGAVRDETHRLLRTATDRINEVGGRHSDECTFWNGHAALELAIELLEGAVSITNRESTAVDELTAYLRASLRTALDEVAAQAREEDALDSGRRKR